MSVPPAVYDVAVIGAGVVGAAIARELARYQIRTVLVEAAPDVGMGTSKANTALWHTGFDATPGTLESRLLQRSYQLLKDFIPQAGVPIEVIGGLLIAWTPEQEHNLPKLLDKARANGDETSHLLTPEQVYHLEPNLGPGALGGMLVPEEGIICTYTLPLAYATQAVLNGVNLRLSFPVRGITTQPDGSYLLESPGGQVACRFLVNAAGLFCDQIDRMLGHADFTVAPRRGELIVYDKFARSLLRHVLLPVPTEFTKGVLISPTVYGNVLLGPTAENVPDRADTATTAAGLEALRRKGEAILPALLHEEVTATYAGLRAATEHQDYWIKLHAPQRYVTVGSIRSTGVSGSMGIAEYVVDLLAEAGLPRVERADFKPVHMPNIGEAGVRPYRAAEMIAADPAYGQIVCHCERVTLGEIRAALTSPLPARTVDGLRRRTRALQGRCQGFNCHGAVVAALAAHTGEEAKRLLAWGEDDKVSG